MDTHWTIEELSQITDQALLQVGYAGQASGRVRVVPDSRTIRYYTTLGILDPPAAMRGRKAFYGPQHVLQLVAIKRLQAQGLSLVQVQQALAGADRKQLAQWAGLPDRFWEGMTAAAAETNHQASGNDVLPVVAAVAHQAFWSAAPAIPEPQIDRPAAAARAEASDWALQLPVCEGVELVLRGVEPGRVTPEVRARLAAMVATLVEPLGRLGLFS